MSPEQLDTLRHMLGINTPDAKEPKPYRNYYCANPGDKKLHELLTLGMVTIYSAHGSYEWFACTDAGKAAAIASHKTIRKSKASRVYSRFLDISDCFPDLTFKQFLVDPEFKQTRVDA